MTIRKRLIPLRPETPPPATDGWLDLNSLAELEITSEDPEHPIDAAIAENDGGDGWRAYNPGEQMIRICFLKPQALRRIHLVFREANRSRTQQFVLRWRAGELEEYREIVRQQYNFNPPGTTEEIEDYEVNLDAVKFLELSMIPDIGGNETFASLRELRLA